MFDKYFFSKGLFPKIISDLNKCNVTVTIGIVISLINLFSFQLNSQTWTNRFSNTQNSLDVATTVLSASNNLSIVVGSSYSPADGWSVSVVANTEAGVQLWNTTYHNTSKTDDKATCAAIDESGNIYVGGISWDKSTGWDYLILKLNSSGTIKWTKHYNGQTSNDDLLTAIAVDNKGFIYVTGSSMNPEITNIVTLKLDATSNKVWEARFNPKSLADEKPTDIAVDGLGNLIVAGNRYDSNSDILVVKYSANGTEVWNKVLNFSGTGSDRLAQMKVTKKNGNFDVIFLAGSTATPNGTLDALVMKLNSDGSTAWKKTYNGSGNGDDKCTALQPDNQNNVFVTAKSTGTSTGIDIATIKFKNDGTQDWVSIFDGQGTAPDNAAPIFAGVSGARKESESSLRINWSSALDDQTEIDEIEYLVYVSNKSGGQDFNNPTATTKKTFAIADNLILDIDYFIVVRSKDKAGNTDLNSRELKTRVVSSPLEITTTELPDGFYGKPYSVQLQAKMWKRKIHLGYFFR